MEPGKLIVPESGNFPVSRFASDLTEAKPFSTAGFSHTLQFYRFAQNQNHQNGAVDGHNFGTRLHEVYMQGKKSPRGRANVYPSRPELPHSLQQSAAQRRARGQLLLHSASPAVPLCPASLPARLHLPSGMQSCGCFKYKLDTVFSIHPWFTAEQLPAAYRLAVGSQGSGLPGDPCVQAAADRHPLQGSPGEAKGARSTILPGFPHFPLPMGISRAEEIAQLARKTQSQSGTHMEHWQSRRKTSPAPSWATKLVTTCRFDRNVFSSAALETTRVTQLVPAPQTQELILFILIPSF